MPDDKDTPKKLKPRDADFIGWALKEAGNSTLAPEILDSRPDDWPDNMELVLIYKGG